MKKLVLVMGIIIAVSLQSMAQEKHHKDFNPEKRAEKITQKMKAELNLTDTQYADVLKLNTTKVAEHSQKHEEYKAEMKAQKMEYMNNLEKILTPAQLKTFKSNMLAKKEAMMKYRSGKHKAKRDS